MNQICSQKKSLLSQNLAGKSHFAFQICVWDESNLVFSFSQLGDLNEYQDDILNKFKEWYAQNHGRLNPWFTDQYLLRFCRARKFDLDKIILMFDNFMKMRAELGIDGMLETYEYPEAAEVAKHYPRGYYGVDKIGRPIYIDCSGRLSVTGVLQNTTEERFWMDMYMSYERLLKLQFLSCSVLYDR